MDGRQIQMALPSSLCAMVPCFGADFFSMLPQQRFGSLLRQVSVVDVEGGRAERVHHFEDAHVHPGTAASVGVLWTG